jgi:hypothetical protein
MNLADIFTALTYGELKSLSLGNFCAEDYESAPDPAHYAQIMSHISLGLTELYTRFMLRTDEIFVQQYEHIEIYSLTWPYAATNTASTQPDKYILDSAESPFLDNVLKVEECYNEIGEKLILNQSKEEESLFTPSFNTIQVPQPVSANVLGVLYRANHPRLTYVKGMQPEEIEIGLPWGLLEALLYYVGMRSFSGTPAVADNNQEGTSYWKKFEASCERYKTNGLQIQPDMENNNFDAKGWR